MATQREIRKRIQSVASTKKITRTMEMISTSKMKKMQDRLIKSRQFEKKLQNMLYTLTASMTVSHNLFNANNDASDCLILMITGNRGLCGGYNTNVIENTLFFKNKLKSEENMDAFIHVIGQKGINYFRLINFPMRRKAANLEDKVSFEYACDLGREMIGLFESNEFNKIYISYTKVISSASYKPAIYQLLPISIEEFQEKISPEGEGLQTKYIFEPGPERILNSLLPLYINMKLYMIFLESGYSEQNARRIAMKNATDAATDMVKDLTIKYNRTRQAKITSEIAEIVGGASALE